MFAIPVAAFVIYRSISMERHHESGAWALIMIKQGPKRTLRHWRVALWQVCQRPLYIRPAIPYALHGPFDLGSPRLSLFPPGSVMSRP